MTTSWKEVYSKLRTSGMMHGGRSDETTSNSDVDTITSSGTPKSSHRFSLADQEWQMNYIINRRDGLYLFINNESLYRYIKSFFLYFTDLRLKRTEKRIRTKIPKNLVGIQVQNLVLTRTW